MAEFAKTKLDAIIVNSIECSGDSVLQGSVTAGVLKPNEIQVAISGSKAIAGETTLVSSGGGTSFAEVSTTAVQSNSIIIITAKEQLDSLHIWYEVNSPGAGFIIRTDSELDNGRKVAWLLINPI